jgi:hypothetical protein
MAPTRTYNRPPSPLDVLPGASTSASTARSETVDRVAAEFREMPGMSLTLSQASRLFDLRPEECGRLFDELQRRGIIQETSDGKYRSREGE